MSAERNACECDEQDDQVCAHAPDPCFSSPETTIPDGEGVPANLCIPCARTHAPSGSWAYWSIGGGQTCACPDCIPGCLDEPENDAPFAFHPPMWGDSCESCGKGA